MFFSKDDIISELYGIQPRPTNSFDLSTANNTDRDKLTRNAISSATGAEYGRRMSGGLGDSNYLSSNNFDDKHRYNIRKIHNTDVNEWKYESRLRNYQKLIFRDLKAGLTNTIISMPPAAGKSKPFQYAYMQRLNESLSRVDNAQNGKPVRLLYVTPTKQLAVEVMNDVREMLRGFLTDRPDLFFNSYRARFAAGGRNDLYVPGDYNIQANGVGGRTFTDANRVEFERKLNDLIALQIGGYNVDGMYFNHESGKRDLKYIVVATYEAASKITERFKEFDFIVVDEIQEFICHPGVNVYDEQKTGKLIEIILNSYKNAKIHLMTGSVNKKSLEQLQIIFEKFTKTQFKIHSYWKGDEIVIDGRREKADDATNASNITIVPYEKLFEQKEREKLVISSVLNKIKYNVMVIFSTARSRPKGLFRLLEDVIKKLPKRDPSVLYDKKISSDEVSDTKKNTRGEGLRGRPNYPMNTNYEPLAKFSDKNKMFLNYIMSKKDFIDREQDLNSLIPNYIITKVESRGDLSFNFSHIEPNVANYYIGSLSNGVFFKGEIGDYILAKTEHPEDKKVELYSVMQIVDVFSDDTAMLKGLTSTNFYVKTYNRAGDVEPKDYSFRTLDMARMSFTSYEGDWKMVNKSIDKAPRGADRTPYGDIIHGNIHGGLATTYDRSVEFAETEDVRLDDIEFLKYFDLGVIENKSNNVEISDDDVVKRYNPENLLYQGILCGVGFLIGSMHNRHKQIVQTLFRQGKIYFLIATDALGVGANVSCQHLYIPDSKKFSDGGNNEIDESSLVQLINRAGRSKDKFPNVSVYVQADNVARIRQLVESDPSVGVPEVNIDFMKDLEHIIKDKKSLFAVIGKLIKRE